MSARMRVAVVGAGVVGLATAAALIDTGAQVRIYDRSEPGQEQSKGRTRVFRLAHGDPRLVALGAQAKELWSAWETRFGRRLLGDEGLIISGDETVVAWGAAMAAAGAPYQVLTIEEAARRLPIARPVGSGALFDPSAGPTRARRTIECLLSICASSFHQQQVTGIERGAVTAGGERWECDEIVIAAGIETGHLASQVGIGVAITVVYDSRFTYPIAPEYVDRSLPIWFDRSGAYGPGYTSYGQRVGSTRFYAVAVGGEDTRDLGPDEESAAHRRMLDRYLLAAYPGLLTDPVDEIRCSYAAQGVREDGDGFMARRTDGVTAVYGNNLFKFAPLIGRLLAESALSGQLPAELAGSV